MLEQDLFEKVAWVTGGGSGMGRAVAQALAAAGAHVYTSGRRAAPLDETVESIRAGGGHCKAILCDVSHAGAAAQAVHAIIKVGVVHYQPFLTGIARA